MTNWPDDWFREPAAGAGGGGAADGAGGLGGAGTGYPDVSSEPPTVEGVAARLNRPARAQGGADPTVQVAHGADVFGATAPAGRHLASDQLTAPGGAAGAGGGWPAQPAVRTSGRQPRAGWRPLPQPTGWRRFLRPRPIAFALAAILSLAVIGTVATYFYLDSQLTKENVLVDYPGRPVQGDGSNWLVTGSDSRQGLTKREIRQFSTGFGISGTGRTPSW